VRVRELAVPIRLFLIIFLAACGGSEMSGPDAPPLPGPPLGDPALVIAFTTFDTSARTPEGTNRCWITLATAEARVRSISSLCAYSPAWRPDGSLLAYDGTGGIWTVHSDGTGMQHIPNTDLGQGTSGFRSPTWAPDGNWLAAWDFSSSGYVVFRLDGTGLRRLSSTRFAEGYQQAYWSPDGHSLVYSRGRTIWEVDVATDVSHLLVDPQLPLAWHPRWSPDGRRIAFVVQTDGTQYIAGPFGTVTQPGALPPESGLWVVNRDGTGLRHIGNEYVTGEAWSQDGRSLLYSASTPGQPRGLYIVPVDGGGASRLFLPDTKSTFSVGVDWVPAR
jgi:Tol biopolymer transport system component